MTQSEKNALGPEIKKMLGIASKTGHLEFVNYITPQIPADILTITEKTPALDRIVSPYFQVESNSDSSPESSSEEVEAPMPRIHCIQHIPTDDLGSIKQWISERGYSLTVSKLWESPNLPTDVNDFDWLILLGGTMSANDDHKYEWMSPEKALIREAVKADKIILGICLGAQLIASSLGAQVKRNTNKEIGWFPLVLTSHGQNSPFFKVVADQVCLWHEDTFDIPEGGILLASSECTVNQAFVLHDSVLGVQFHPEFTYEGTKELVSSNMQEFSTGSFVQSADEFLNAEKFKGQEKMTINILEKLEEVSILRTLQ